MSKQHLGTKSGEEIKGSSTFHFHIFKRTLSAKGGEGVKDNSAYKNENLYTR